MNIIDENIVFSQRQRLTELKIHYNQIGFEIGRLAMNYTTSLQRIQKNSVVAVAILTRESEDVPPISLWRE